MDDRNGRGRRTGFTGDQVGYGMADYAQRHNAPDRPHEGRSPGDRRAADPDDFGYVGRGYEDQGFDRRSGGGRGDRGNENYVSFHSGSFREASGGYGSGDSSGPRMRGGYGGEGYNNYGETYSGGSNGPRFVSGGRYGTDPGGNAFRAGYGGSSNYDRGYQSNEPGFTGEGLDDEGRPRDRGLFRGGGGVIPGTENHRGRGPRNARRSDERIHDDVIVRLTDDPYLDASDIDVTVSGGEVTLSGHVASRADKRRAEDIADSVSGVTHVQNDLRVQILASPGRTTFGMASGARDGGEGSATREGGSGSPHPAASGVSAASGITGTSGASGSRTGERAGAGSSAFTTGRTDDTGSSR